MNQFLHSVRRFLCSEDGPTSVEYCFMMAFILLVVISAIGTLGETTFALFETTDETLPE